jgi:hypothetical protein
VICRKIRAKQNNEIGCCREGEILKFKGKKRRQKFKASSSPTNNTPPAQIGPSITKFNMGKEEQQEEREVLQSIFQDELTGLFLLIYPTEMLIIF